MTTSQQLAGRRTDQRVLNALIDLRAAGKPANVVRIARHLGMSRTTVHYAMVRLETARAVRAEGGQTRSLVWVPTRCDAHPESEETR